MTIHDYLQDFARALANQNGSKLRDLLTINPADGQGAARAKFNDPSEVDLYPIAEKFHPVIRSYLTAMRSIYISSDINASFYNLNDLVLAFNRAAETQTNWLCPALINCSDELISLYQVRAKQAQDPARVSGQKSNTDKVSRDSSEEPLELIAATINKSFKMCLTDKTLDFSVSKKSSIHFFLAALIKIYFKLNKLELAKSMEKALVGTGLAVPTIVNSPVEYRKHIVTYLYFSALLSLDESDFAFAETKLSTAMDFLSCYKRQGKIQAQTEKILLLLAPLKFYNSRSVLPSNVYEKFENLRFLYHENIFKAIKMGNLHMFDKCVSRFQKILLKRHIYILVVQLKNLCYLRLIQRTVKILSTPQSASSHIVPLSALRLAIEFSFDNRVSDTGEYMVAKSFANQDYAHSTDEVECILANLIYKRWIKGYISHSNKCIVFSKTDAFPKV